MVEVYQDEELAKLVMQRDAELRAARGEEESMWQLTSRYCIPRKAFFTEKTSYNTLRERQILDSTAPRSAELFAAFLFSSINNPMTRWFDFEMTGQEEGSRNPAPHAVTEFIGKVRNRMLKAMTTGKAPRTSATNMVV